MFRHHDGREQRCYPIGKKVGQGSRFRVLTNTTNLFRTTTTKEIREQIASELGISSEEHKDEIDQAIDAAISSLFLLDDEPSDDKVNTSSSESKIKKNSEEHVKSSSTGSDKKQAHLDRLKSYVFKCGVRKVWKKELDGLSTTQSIAKVTRCLEGLGMQGRPTLQKCKEIRERREYEKEMEVIDESNIVSSRLRTKETPKRPTMVQVEDTFAFLSRLGDPDA